MHLRRVCYVFPRLTAGKSMFDGSGPLQWIGEPAVAATNHNIGPEALRTIQLKIRGKIPSNLLDHPSGLQNTTGLQPCGDEPNDWNDDAPC